VGQEFILSILSIVIPSISAILSIAYATYRVGKKFGEIDEKFKRIDERFNELKDYVGLRELLGLVECSHLIRNSLLSIYL